ncbi:MAG: LD-carboxypeptidase [Bacteroidales bacterium]|nr:LD-carboxypeptidase [Bacteroidales bacterium]
MSGIKIQPDFLKTGDEVAIISPSFFIEEQKVIDAVAILEGWGLKVRVGKNTFKRSGSFAGSDEERLSDLQEMTDDPAIKAILCSRGGYGVARIIGNADFSKLKRSPKWYAGFSDITVLHLWLSEVVGIMSLHSDMPLNYSNPGKSAATLETIRQALFGELGSCEWTGQMYRAMNATGEVTGGNLSLVYSLMGTAALPDTEGKIFFIEEVGEYFYHLDRMLTSLKLAGRLKGLSALVVGGMNKIDEAKVPWGKSVEETIRDIVEEYDYPVFFDFPAGHISDNRAFYIGKTAKIEIRDGEASLIYT